jgi:UDP-glucose 4-epimerase
VSPSSNQRVLITGGAGYIGSRLAVRLASQGVLSVIALDNLRRGTEESLSVERGAIRLVHGDIRDEHTLDQAMKAVDVVFHLAAESAVMAAGADPEYCFSTNVTGTFRVLQAARAHGVRRVVFASSREVYGDPVHLPVPESAPLRPRNAYGASKAAAEMCCAAFASGGLNISIVRLSNVYGPGDKGRVIPRFVHNALLGLPLTVFGGEQLLDFVWIETVLDCLMRVGFGPCVRQPLNIGSGRGVPIVELCERIVHAAASSSKVHVVPRREGEVVRFEADIAAAGKALGLEAPADPLAGLTKVIAAARETMQLHEEALTLR